jgi:hypothetical protein
MCHIKLKVISWLVFKEEEVQQQKQDAENPFLDLPFSRIKSKLPINRRDSR